MKKYMILIGSDAGTAARAQHELLDAGFRWVDGDTKVAAICKSAILLVNVGSPRAFCYRAFGNHISDTSPVGDIVIIEPTPGFASKLEGALTCCEKHYTRGFNYCPMCGSTYGKES